MNTQNDSHFLEIFNNGHTITHTNFWESQIARKGFFFLSINGGAARLLVPENFQSLQNITSCDYIILTRGLWLGSPSYELLFEDHSDAPYMLHMTYGSYDRLLPASEAGRDFPLLVYVRGEEHPVIVSRKPARYRFVSQLPWMKPIKFPPVIPDAPLSQKTGAHS